MVIKSDPRINVSQIYIFCRTFPGKFLILKLIIAENLHSKPPASPRDSLSNTPRSDYAQGFLPHFYSRGPGLISAFYTLIHKRDISGTGQHESHCQIRHRISVGSRGNRHSDLLLSGTLQIHLIVSHPIS